VITWTAHPAKRRPQDAMLAACVICATAYAVLVGLRSPLLAVLAVVFLLVAIAPFLLPTRYTLDGERISERRGFVTRSRPWSELERLEVGKTAALVSPYKTPRFLDRYRGITILLPAPGEQADREVVVRMLRDHVRSREDHG
jgi:hypothetical protein